MLGSQFYEHIPKLSVVKEGGGEIRRCDAVFVYTLYSWYCFLVVLFDLESSFQYTLWFFWLPSSNN